jgi:hypothetical protein
LLLVILKKNYKINNLPSLAFALLNSVELRLKEVQLIIAQATTEVVVEVDVAVDLFDHLV